MKLRMLAMLLIVAAATMAGGVTASASDTITRTPFHVSYGPPQITCSGVRVVKTGANGFVKDEETCVAHTDFYAPGVYELADPSFGGWCSDFEGFRTDDPYCRLAIAGTLTVTATGEGTSIWRIVAYYNR